MSNSNNNEISSAAAPVRQLHQVSIFFEHNRPCIGKIPSPKCQTILYQSAMEHLWGVEHCASFALTSETFRNSSFGANFLMNFTVEHQNVPLFKQILTPASCMSLQFTHALSMNICYEYDDRGDYVTDCKDTQDFAMKVVHTKYFRLQLQTLRIDWAHKP